LAASYWLRAGHNPSIASAIGFIALAGVTAEFGVIMVLYLRQAWDDRLARG
jgi:Cu(I)/Ag(I) efflux system membrane protein CusA/SilA